MKLKQQLNGEKQGKNVMESQPCYTEPREQGNPTKDIRPSIWAPVLCPVRGKAW